MKDLIVQVPINDTSIGNVSIAFLRELYELDINISLFPVSDLVNIDVYDDLDQGFINWMNNSFENRFKSLKRDTPSLQVWHINGSEKRISNNNFLYTFHETDKPTLSERNICNIHKKVIFSSKFSKDLFSSIGVKNCESVPLGLDKCFNIKEKKFGNHVKHFGLMGKFEKRKNTSLILEAWAEKFGNNPDFQLSCAVINRFIDSGKLNQLIGTALKGKTYSNINFLPFLPKNSDVNTLINSIDIDLTGLSGGEGWNIPAFTSTCLGKWSCVTNCTSHKDWANESNCILIEPEGTFNSDDGIFFKEGAEFNQGNFNSISKESINNAFDTAIEKSRKTNDLGMKLIDKFNYKKSIESILDIIYN